MPADYDALAWFYDRYWGRRFHDAARPALERLLYASLAPGDRVVDLCCGSGHLTQELVARRYAALGIDASLGMLRAARRRVPHCPFVCADAAAFALASADSAAVVSTFDSMNHLMTVVRLAAACRCAASVLRPGGLFVFDLNTEEAYLSEWGKSSAIVEPDAALFVRGGYDARSGIGRTSITAFRLDGTWRRSDVDIAQCWFAPADIAASLDRGGFVDSELVPAAAAGMADDLAAGRIFVRARRG